jgi:hypothetical protein
VRCKRGGVAAAAALICGIVRCCQLLLLLPAPWCLRAGPGGLPPRNGTFMEVPFS